MSKRTNYFRVDALIKGKQCVVLFFLSFVLLSSACSVKKNNAATRFYHNLTTRYNVLYNGQKAFDEAYDKDLENIEESYVELIPYSYIYYNAHRDRALGSYQRAIEKSEKAIKEHSLRTKPKRKRGWKKNPKAVAMQEKKEYNTYLKHAWFLLAKSQYYNAEFNKSLSSFAYIANLYKSDEELYAHAVLWQARVLILLERSNEAIELMKALQLEDKPKLQKKLKDLYPKVWAEYYLQTKNYAKALEILPDAIKGTKHKIQKARLYYLMGQLNQIDSLNKNSKDSYNCFSKVLKLSPPQALEFATRLKKSELSPKGKMENLRLLKRMSHKRRYRKNLDQIYYAMGNTYLSLQDSTKALEHYQLGADSSEVKKYDYLLNLMALGRIYIKKGAWLKAQPPISEIASTLDNKHRDYSYYQDLSKGLDALSQPARVIYEKDSLIRLARMTEGERNTIIDKRIAELKKKEKAQRKEAYKDTEFETGFNNDNKRTENLDPMSSFEKGKFYFYNHKLLAQGRHDFQHKWGKRKLADFWNLRKKPNLNINNTEDLDSLSKQSIKPKDNIAELELSQDPHERSYYLANIPFSKEAQAEAKEEIRKAMLEEAAILRDKLDFLQASYKCYKRYAKLYPQAEDMDKVLYASYLLALRLNLPTEAEHYRLAYLDKYPKTKLALKLVNKDYIQSLRQNDKEIAKDYKLCYEAYLSSDAKRVEELYQKVKSENKDNKLYPRFVLLSAMAKVINGEQKAFIERLEEVKEIGLDKEAMALVSSMLGELQKGRRIIPTSPKAFNTEYQSLANKEIRQNFSNSNFKEEDRTRNLSILIIIPKQALTEAELIYYVSLYNFVHYTQENLELRNLSSDIFSALMVQSLRTDKAAEEYMSTLLRSKELQDLKLASYCFIAHNNANQVLSLDDYKVYLNYLKTKAQYTKESQRKLNYLANPPEITKPKEIEKTEEKADVLKSIDGTKTKKERISYEDIEVLAKERERKKQDLAKQKRKEKEARLKAREQERKRKLKERRRRQKEKAKARKRKL